MYGQKRKAISVGIDLDDTISLAPEMFKQIIAVLKKFGCDVYIVTARDKNQHCELSREFEPLVDAVIFCSNKAKQDVAEIDIWIDDFPLAITHDFKETCWVAGEGIVKRMEIKQ